MARRLSNLEYVTFLDEVDPWNLNLPPWGGIVQWYQQYVLCFLMPSGEWALSDVTDGIPYGNTVIPIQTYIGNLERHISPSQWSWYDVKNDILEFFTSAASQGAVAIQTVAGAAIQLTAQQIGDAIKKVLGGASAGLGDAIWPIAAGLVAVAYIMYGKK